MERIRLNACQHCGKNTVRIVSCQDAQCRTAYKERCGSCPYFGYRAECVMRLGGCGATGGKRGSEASAAEAWNDFKPAFTVGQVVWYVRRSGSKRPSHEVKQGVLSELGYTSTMKLAGAVKYGSKGVIGEVIFASAEEATQKANELNSQK